MYRETIKDVENFKSEEFKGLKEKDEELLYGTRNSDAVMGVQNFLNENGYTDQNDEKLTVNGRYEANTANAVIKYQKDNNLTVDGIVGDETWDSMYNKKKKKEENDSFAEGLKTKSGGWFYDRIQSIRKAQHDLGITSSGKIDEENESSAEDDFHGRVRRQWERGKNTDVWNTPKVEKYPYDESIGQEIWGRNVPKRERMPWEAIGEMQGRNIPDKAVKPDSGRAPDVQAKPWQRNVHDSKGQMPWGSYVPRERNPRDINTRQGRNAYDESKTTAFFPSDYNLQNFPPYIKNALAYTDKTGETGAKVQPLAGGVRTPGINAHLNFIPDYAMKKPEKKAEAEKPYILPLSERANEASGEYEPADEYFLNTESDKTQEKEKVNPAPKPEEDGIIKPGYNAKGEWSEDPDADNYGKDSSKYKLLTVFDKAWDIATENEDDNARIAIEVTVKNLRSYDTESITQAYYLIDNQGAYGAGHAGILLINEKGEGILFSYFRHSDAEGIWNVQSDTRIAVLTPEATDKFLWGSTIKTPSSSGEFCTEQYDKGLKYKITPEQGKKVLESGINIASNNPKYNLFIRNCSQIAQRMLIYGGVLQRGEIIPKAAYLKNIIFSDGIIVNGK